jgi:hypothetical protein
MTAAPLLIGAALLFWGWQSGFLLPAVVMAGVLEGARLVKTRWDFSDDDFARIWTFCSLVLLGAAVVAFSYNEGPSSFRHLLERPGLTNQRNAGLAAGRAAAALLRWLPMIFFPFVCARAFSPKEAIPLETISLIMRVRWKKARKLGGPVPPTVNFDVWWPYFGLCLISAGIRSRPDTAFFWGVCALTAWALWPYRSRRYPLVVWVALLLVAVGLAFLGQAAMSNAARYFENLNIQWLSSVGHGRFDPSQSRTQLGEVGRLKTSGKIVIRLEARDGRPAPALLREASYRFYRNQVWSSGRTRPQFETISEGAEKGAWTLIPGKTNNFSVHIASWLPGGKGLLPLPEGSARLENLPAYILERNACGAVLAQGPGLVAYDALYAPGSTIDAPPDAEEDLAVPSLDAPALDRVVSDLRLKGKTRRQAIETLTVLFLTNFTYSVWSERRDPHQTNETALTRFLLKTRTGHCEYFATAGVLLLRQLGIPARYAVGYAVHEGKPGGRYVVRQRDAHAWCLVWSEAARVWQTFDPTPPSWVAKENHNASAFQWLSDAWSKIRFEIARIRWGQGNLRQYILWGLAPVLALLLYQILSRKRTRHARSARAVSAPELWPGSDSEFYELERRLAARGLGRRPEEPLSEWLARAAATPGLRVVREAADELLRLHYRYRFDPLGLSPDEREALRQRARACVQAISSGPG